MSLGYIHEMNTYAGWVLGWSERAPDAKRADVRNIAEVTPADAKLTDRTARASALLPDGKADATANDLEWLAKLGDRVKVVAEAEEAKLEAEAKP